MSEGDLEARWARPDERQAVAYWLGQLDENERSSVELRIVSDPSFKDFVDAIELELIDAWANGTLADADRNQFESVYSQTPAGRQKIRHYRTMASTNRTRTWRWAVPLLAALGVIAVWVLMRKPPLATAPQAPTTSAEIIVVRDFALSAVPTRGARGSDTLLDLRPEEKLIRFQFPRAVPNANRSVLLDENEIQVATVQLSPSARPPVIELATQALKTGTYVWRLQRDSMTLASFQFSVRKP